MSSLSVGRNLHEVDVIAGNKLFPASLDLGCGRSQRCAICEICGYFFNLCQEGLPDWKFPSPVEWMHSVLGNIVIFIILTGTALILFFIIPEMLNEIFSMLNQYKKLRKSASNHRV